MKALDIAIKDMTRSFRSLFAVVFMFGVPLLVTGMFYFMFGNLASGGEFSLPKTKVVLANLDQGGPKFQVSTKNIPGGRQAETMGELVAAVLQSEEMADLIEVSISSDGGAARAAVDRQEAQVAIIIPPDFSTQFSDLNGKAVIEFYQDPTLTIGPGIIRSILNRFMDGMASVKIAVNVFMDQAEPQEAALAGQVVQRYLEISQIQRENAEEALIDVRLPSSGTTDEAGENSNPLLSIISPIMGSMMIFYAFFTGTSTAESILREEEERTLPRLFTTPTPQATILSGKFIAVFLTVLVQIVVLIAAARVIFGIRWGAFLPLAITATGVVLCASTFGIFINSFLKTTKQGGVIFGGVLTVTGMLGMVSIFAMNSPAAARLSDTVALLVPQGWAIRGLLQMLNGEPVTDILTSALVMLAWSAVFFAIGVWRFNKRYG